MARNFSLTHRLTQLYSKLMPAPCLLCGIASQQLPLCTDCIADLPHLGHACSRCAMPIDAGKLCGHCLSQPPEQDYSVSLFPYLDPVDRLIAAFKYHDKLYLSQLFGTLMSEQLQARKLPQCLIPIPLYPSRLRQRGYNQSLELAKVLSTQLAIPTSNDYLIRTRNTAPQTSLPFDQRKANIERAFSLQQKTVPDHIALIDDVLTTGHTANAAAKCLRQAGATTIEVWTIARTISHDHILI